MALQLTGAAKKDSIANLQIRLPVVVIGGGLTAIDTATESLAYYPLQVEKFLARYETLVAERGEARCAGWSDEEREIAEEFIAHARAIRAERAAAAREGREPAIAKLVNGWGGVTIAYRRRLIDSPSYTLNHEEVHKALEEDIRFAEGLSPVAVEVDGYGAAKRAQGRGPAGRREGRGDAAGAHHPGRRRHAAQHRAGARGCDARLHRRQVLPRARRGGRAGRRPSGSSKPDEVRVLMYRHADGRFMSFFGDLHPSFAGNVVKAMGGAKQGYPVLTAHAWRQLPAPKRTPQRDPRRGQSSLARQVVRGRAADADHRRGRGRGAGRRAQLRARPVLSPAELRGPRSKKVDGTLLTMEGLALTGAWVDKDKGLLSLIALEMGGSSDLCALLEPGEPVIVMGPTGTPTEIEPGETVVLAGGGLGNAVLFSIGQAFRTRRQQGALLRRLQEGDRPLQGRGDRGRGRRRRVVLRRGAGLRAVAAAGQGASSATSSRRCSRTPRASWATQPIPFNDADRIIAIGSDGMMDAVRLARHAVLKPYLKPDHARSARSTRRCNA